MIDTLFLYKLCILSRTYFTGKGPAVDFCYHTKSITNDSLNNSKLAKMYYYASTILRSEEEAVKVVTLSDFWDGNIVWICDAINDLKKQALWLDATARNYKNDIQKLTKSDLTNGNIFTMLMEEKISPFTFSILVQKHPVIKETSDDLLKNKFIAHAPKLLVANKLMTPEKRVTKRKRSEAVDLERV